MALEKEMWPNRAAALAKQEKGLAGATLSKIDLNLVQRQVRDLSRPSLWKRLGSFLICSY